MKETWRRDEASHEIDLNIEALRALTHTANANVHSRAQVQSEGQDYALEDEKRT